MLVIGGWRSVKDFAYKKGPSNESPFLRRRKCEWYVEP